MDNNYNNQTFTCIGRGHGAAVTPATLEEWREVRRQPWLAELCRRIEAGDDADTCPSGHPIAPSFVTATGPRRTPCAHCRA